VHHERQPVGFDWNQYVQASNKKPCFICRLSAGAPNYQHHVIFQDDFCIAFLDKHPRQYGHCRSPARAYSSPKNANSKNSKNRIAL
jgi:hypothetical protein